MRQPEFPVRGSDTAHAFGWGLLVASSLIAAIFVGSRSLKDFDPALVSYAGASVFAAFGIGYRYSMWLRRPPTRLYWYRGWQLFLRPRQLPGNILHLGRIFWNNIFLQRFIGKRSRIRWTAHWFLAWGCLLAAAVTFPLSFGWVRFETARNSQEIYNAFMFGIPVGSFHLGTVVAELTFNILDIAAVMVLVGVFFAFWRRGRDRDARSVQQFANDLLPLILLFAISITGLFLTASTHLMHGLHYVFLSQLHAITVIFTLLYLPFGSSSISFSVPRNLEWTSTRKPEPKANRPFAPAVARPLDRGCRWKISKVCRQRLAFTIKWLTELTTRMSALRAAARILRWRRTVSGNPSAKTYAGWERNCNSGKASDRYS